MMDMVVWISVTKSDMSVPCFVGRGQSLWWYRSWRSRRQLHCALFCDALFEPFFGQPPSPPLTFV